MADDKMRKNIIIPLFVILRTPGVWRGARWRGPAERRCGGRPGQARAALVSGTCRDKERLLQAGPSTSLAPALLLQPEM